MVLGWRKHWVMGALFTLLALVFVAVPAADAAACGFEPAQVHDVSTVTDGDGGGEPASSEHGLCAHGHCHHGGVALTAGPQVPKAVQSGADTTFRAASPPFDSHPPTGLERPPRG